jgi:hypothetical protein
MPGASAKHMPSHRASSGQTENNTMRYTILDNPPWWEAIALGFQVSCTHTPAFRDPSSKVEHLSPDTLLMGCLPSKRILYYPYITSAC